MDGYRDFIIFNLLVQQDGVDLFDELHPDYAVGKRTRPSALVFAFGEVVGELFEHGVLGAECEQFLVVLALFVGNVSQLVVVFVFAVLADDPGVVDVVGGEDGLGGFAVVDLDFEERVVHLDHHVAFFYPRLEPVAGQLEPAFFVERVDHFGDVAIHPDFVQQAFHILFILILVDQYFEHFWCSLGIDLENECVNVLSKLFIVQQLGNELINKIMSVAD